MHHRTCGAMLLLLLLAACRPTGPDGPPAPSPIAARPTGAPAPRPTSAATSAPTPAPTSAPAATTPPTSTPAPAAAATPAPDPGAEYAAAMRPGAEGDIAALPGLPRYDLRLRIDPAAGALAGDEQIELTNRTGVELADVALRLYPNFPRDVFGKGGDVRMEVTGAAAGGQPASFAYAAERTAALVALPSPLAPGQSVTLAISFTATLKPWRDGTWPLPSYYPMLAAHDGAGWRLDVTRFADRVYAESAIYRAEVAVPAGLQVVASGSGGAARAGADGYDTYTIHSGPIRELALTVGDFAVARASAGDVAVNVYTARGSRLDARAVAQVSARALADFDARFGRYPYRELDVHLLPYEFDGGDEYPGLILLYAAGPIGAGARYVAAHEVAHQWWYGVVGNDIYREPWLDEALAQYSGIIYAEDVAGAAVAAADWEREVLRRYRGAQADGDLPVGLAIAGYPSFNVYYRTVYGKGPVFLRALRDELGDDAFFAGLRRYYGEQRYGVGTGAALRRAFEQAAGRDLGAIFRAWVGGG